MFFFRHTSDKSANQTSENAGTYVFPEPEDLAAFRELEQQRAKWKSLLSSKSNIWNEEWLWSNRKRKAEKDGPIKKKIMLLFSAKVKSRKQMKKLIRGGVPPELRGQVWYACSGAEKKKSTAKSTETYSHLLTLLPTLHRTQISADIEKDLLRTFPERIGNDDIEFIEKMRRLLMTYAIRNPTVGYCQSMNYICALLLFHMEEERAFWVFTMIIEDILPPNYYTPTLLGGRIDQQVFQACIAWKLPKVYETFRSTHTLLEPIICPWFLCLYINVLPLYTVCRVWDCLFWEGNVVLFRIGLALMTSKAPQILQSEDFISIYSILKSSHNKEYSFILESADTNNTNSNSNTNTNSLFAVPSPTSSHSAGYLVDDDATAISSPVLIQQQTMSDTEFLFRSSFGFRWLKSIPTVQVEALRKKFFVLLSEETNNTTTSSAANRSNKHNKSNNKKAVAAAAAAVAVGENDSRTRSLGHDENEEIVFEDDNDNNNALEGEEVITTTNPAYYKNTEDMKHRGGRHRGSVLMMKLLEEVE